MFKLYGSFIYLCKNYSGKMGSHRGKAWEAPAMPLTARSPVPTVLHCSGITEQEKAEPSVAMEEQLSSKRWQGMIEVHSETSYTRVLP